MPLARIWMHNGMVQLDAEKMSKSEGNIFQLSEALDRYGPEAVVAYLVSGHYRQPLAFSRGGAARRRRARVERIRNYLRASAPGGEPGRVRRRPAASEFLDALADDFNTPRRFAALVRAGRRGQPRASCRAPAAALEELLPLLGPRVAARRRRRPPTPRPRGCSPSASEARAAQGLRARRRDPRRARRELGWEVRDEAEGARLVRRRLSAGLSRAASSSTARRPVAEAERGRRRVHGCWRAPETPAEELERLCGSPDHQGVVAEVDPYPYADPGLAARGRRRHRAGGRARPGPGPAQPRGDLPQRRGRRGGRGGDPRAPRGRGHAGRVQGVGGRGRAPARWPGCETSPTGWARRRRPAPGSTAPAPSAEKRYTEVDWVGRAVLVLGCEGKGLRPRVARHVRRAGLDPARGGSAR